MKKISSTFHKPYYGLGRWSVFDEDHPLISEKKGGKPLELHNGSRRRSVLDEDHGDHGQEEEEEEGRQGGQGGPRVINHDDDDSDVVCDNDDNDGKI